MRRFKFLEHTADLSIRVNGKTLKDLFINCAYAVSGLISEPQHDDSCERKISLEGELIEDLLVYWLNELISLFYTYNFVPAKYNINIIDAEVKRIEAVVSGSRIDSKITNIKMEIKAATHHNLKIKKTNSGYTVDIIFDV